MNSTSSASPHDAFGNPLDPTVGYARGQLLSSSADEVRRLRRAQMVAAERVAEHGLASIGVFTGNAREFPLTADELELAEEWIGPGRFADRLQAVAIDHLGGQPTDVAVVTNRTSGGIVAAVLALNEGRPVVSVVPDGDRSHASVIRGCALAGVELVETGGGGSVRDVIESTNPALVVITTVTSTLVRMPDDLTRSAVAAAHDHGATVFMDEAYGARLRPVLHDGAKSLELGGDLAITNTDKAGLSGPRGGVLVGREGPVLAVLARASELGIEARAPIALGAVRSLEGFAPELLLQEAADGAAVADALVARLGDEGLVRSDLGPSLAEDVVMQRALDRRGTDHTDLVPCEVTAAVGMLLLRDHGVLTVNTHGQPGGRVSIRLKPTAGAAEAVGGAVALAAAVDGAIDTIAAKLSDLSWFEALLFGSEGT